MLWTWDRAEAATARWPRDTEASYPGVDREAMTHFMTSIDVALYVAVVAFAGCVASILL